MSLSFKRTIEDFICDHCGKKVNGDGYTNHCPYCLWGKHVDINPGDRAENCHGLMEPIEIEFKNKKYIIIHKCIKCGKIKKNKANKNDNFDEILNLTN